MAYKMTAEEKAQALEFSAKVPVFWIMELYGIPNECPNCGQEMHYFKKRNALNCFRCTGSEGGFIDPARVLQLSKKKTGWKSDIAYVLDIINKNPNILDQYHEAYLYGAESGRISLNPNISQYDSLFPLTLEYEKSFHKYFKERGFSPETVEALPLGIYNGEPVAAFTRDGKVYGANRVQLKQTVSGSRVIPFNGDRLFEGHDLLFVTEGWADAVSLEELGCKAVSVNGIGNTDKFINEVKLLEKNKENSNTTYIILYDNDITSPVNRGKIEEERFVEEMVLTGIKVIGADIGNFINSRELTKDNKPLKDFNDLLVFDRKISIEFLKEAIVGEQKSLQKQKAIKNIRSREGF